MRIHPLSLQSLQRQLHNTDSAYHHHQRRPTLDPPLTMADAINPNTNTSTPPTNIFPPPNTPPQLPSTNTDNNHAEPPTSPANMTNSADTDNYDITEDDETNPTPSPTTSNNTNDLLRRIDELADMLDLERDNNNVLMQTLEYERTDNRQQINELRNEMKHLQPPTTKTPPHDNMMYTLIQQQQQMMQAQMQQNNDLLHKFGSGLQALQKATLKSATATERQADETIASRIKKGPLTNRFPKFAAKENEIFIDWYDDLLCILSLSEWGPIYNTITNDIKDTTTDDNKQLSEHLYTSLRLALHGEAGSIMKSNEHKYRNHGLEYLQSMKPIFHPKWPPSTHNTKLVAFYSTFRAPTTSIDTFANTFKRLMRDLHYNGITISPESAKHTFLQGLGSEFITIRNMKTPPEEFQTNDIDTLTTVAREHLARIVGNRAIQKQQQQQNRSSNTPNANPPPSRTPPPTSPSPSNPPNRPSNIPNPLPPRRPYPDQTDYQREIMREIGFGMHSTDRINYWQSLTEPNHCYFHRIPHSSTSCGRLQRSIQRAAAGNPPTSTFIPNPQFNGNPPPNPAPPAAPPVPAASRPPPRPPAPPAPTARVVNVIDDSSDDDSNDNIIVDINDYNYDADYYSTPSFPKPPSKSKFEEFRFIVDSGATEHMCNSKNLFISFTPTSDKQASVTLGDGSTKSPIEGKGTIAYTTQGHLIHLHDVLYVPNLNVNLYSVKQHMKVQGCSEHSEANICTIAYPNFTIQASTAHEIQFMATKPPLPSSTPDFDSSSSIMNIIPQQIPYSFKPEQQHADVKISSSFKTKPLKHIPTRSTEGAIGYDLFSAHKTSVPPNSRKSIGLGFHISIPQGLYGRIAPRSGLAITNNIDIAGGVIDPDYRGEVKVILINSSQKRFDIEEGDRIAQLIFEKAATPAFQLLRTLDQTIRAKGGFGSTGTTALNTTSPPTNVPNIIENDDPSPPPQQTSTNDTQPIFDTPLVHDPPPIRPIDKPQDVDSSSKTITVEELRKCIGYRNTDNLLPHLKSCFQNNFHVSSIDREPVLDLGETSTIDKTRIPTSPVQLPKNFGDVMHCDIGYGCNAGLSGIRYALFVVDRATRYKYVYPIKSLKDDILPAFQSLVKDMGFAPKKIMTDFDHKLMGESVELYFTPLGTTIESAPPKHQHKNGLVERNWRTVIRMARSWLSSALLPSSFWYHAVKRAIEVTNYLPVTLNGITTTPFEVVHHHKPDIRSLIPLFSVAYIDHPNTGTTATPTFTSQSLRVILIGRSTKSTALEFYHPPTKQILTSSVYRLDPTLASGPLFNLHYDGGLFFNTYHNEAASTQAPTFQLDQTVYFETKLGSGDFIHGKILTIPFSDSNIYSIQRHDNKNIIQMPISRITPSNPNAVLTNELQTIDRALPSWIKQNVAATLFLDTMPKPRRGVLKQHDDEQWYFHFGRHNSTEPVLLQHFHRDGLALIQQGHLIRGHPSFHKIYSQRQSELFQESVARHVSAANLHNLDTPTLTQMHSLDKVDKEQWKKAYDEEYYGLEELPAWTHITESQYQQLRPTVGNALPTMAISTIKYDENGQPKRCKWRIVALGNLDPYAWTSNDCYAPVMSMVELRLLTSLAVHHKRTLKNGDIKQAFVQAVLPDHEQYVLRPPPGCPNTPKDTYWLLKRTLYGLKRSPRHWFIKATQLLADCGLYPTPNNPCLFQGKPDGIHTLYLGLYVDDLCYFSTSDSCEKAFEQKLQSLTNVDLMGDISHFLGIKYKWTKHDNGHLTAHLSQHAFAEQLVTNNNLSDANIAHTPYRTGHPVDSVPHTKLSDGERRRLTTELRSIVGSLLWLSQATRPDLSTIVSMLAQYQANPSYGHIRAAKHAIKYVKGTMSKGITFSSLKNTQLQAFMNFPIQNNTLIPLTDANWGGQDQGHSRSSMTELDRFKTRSMSGFIIFFNGPIHWSSKRQKVTARSSAEAEIYATDECVKELLRLRHACTDLNILNIYMPGSPISVYNDNNACVCWSKSTTTKGLRHITIRENAIRESVDNQFVKILHIAGKSNLADMFTKELKSVTLFKTLRDLAVQDPDYLPPIEISHTLPRREGGIRTDGQTVSTEPPHQ